MGCIGSKSETYIIEKYAAGELASEVTTPVSEVKGKGVEGKGEGKGKRNSKAVIPKEETGIESEGDADSGGASPDGKRKKKDKKEKSAKSLVQKKVSFNPARLCC